MKALELETLTDRIDPGDWRFLLLMAGKTVAKVRRMLTIKSDCDITCAHQIEHIFKHRKVEGFLEVDVSPGFFG